MTQRCKASLFVACLLPLAWLAWMSTSRVADGKQTAVIIHLTGEWSLILLLITLSITPLRKLTGQLWLIRYRRMLGLFAFFYAVLHLLAYVSLEHSWDLQKILEDLSRRPFVAVGFSGFVLLVPLAITSTSGWIRRLGGRRWSLLHRLTYVAASAGVIHVCLANMDAPRSLEYAFVLGSLFLYRVLTWLFPSMNRLTAKLVWQPVGSLFKRRSC
jgi:sulfoxide reductase heme-binding subunit YedZ